MTQGPQPFPGGDQRLQIGSPLRVPSGRRPSLHVLQDGDQLFRHFKVALIAGKVKRNQHQVGTAAKLGVTRQPRLAGIRRSLGKTSVRSRNRACCCRRRYEPEAGGPRRVVTTAC